ncbi:iron-siderophore ABC transporter substrate-binding protein [Vibrio sp. DW001]|uniref:iron-siderophore ABC transporter substrate-binding protein n=1 Tax=Vibrio sp. DW001 TaxID=2912315 RepID=UPI0023B1B499|nr:iron-siderophore ABC transporter substrate-binding protein [Vibrio sp. DW001]WED28961.1 iron-siderophore ABC transporter substrate-binding protein [Vibrio sp. DW001]
MLIKSIFITLCALYSGYPFAQIEPESSQIQIKDTRGLQILSKVPVKVAALNWDIAEQVLELGVVPVAMPNITGYSEWVVRPEVPSSVQDIGTRVEPNIERLAELKPDVIIISSPQVDLIPRLERIAPVLTFETFSADHDNVKAAIQNFRSIAKVLGKQMYAEEKLERMFYELDQLKNKLETAYEGKLPTVAAFRFSSTSSIYLYGDNSITQFALQQLGVSPALPQPPTQWGVTQKRLNALFELTDESVALYFKPFEQEKKVTNSVLWKAMPLVRSHRVNSVSAVWNYGGAMSILYNAQVLSTALLEIAPNTVKMN